MQYLHSIRAHARLWLAVVYDIRDQIVRGVLVSGTRTLVQQLVQVDISTQDTHTCDALIPHAHSLDRKIDNRRILLEKVPIFVKTFVVDNQIRRQVDECETFDEILIVRIVCLLRFAVEFVE